MFGDNTNLMKLAMNVGWTQKLGRLFGWAGARYDTPKSCFKAEFSPAVYSRSPEESGQRISSHLLKFFADGETGSLEMLLSKSQVRIE